ncbi:MAG: Chromosome segregation and condensation protein ScpA [Candidatus Magasanikbacteria bacterium GW2011_GWA2_45_39]|uniref:Segregation and condensation protein A n=2 Tax=Candidatus Magasanikiibacteriota TaxID=1752731 RepID=A0A0G1N053_9BACT|nr:MAG: Chromosome segregation and condensation protein ScpA [Candidatus Magasanikbacteria bacterium GW2011_GWA2_45_39]KKU13722.1 MAG: Chromosome segregation and condensation protein ScpA [Candidatus Magasanikbacteria bacterium GW2011_GWC2_45_8]
MSYEIKLEQFSGPLELLLQLIEREQMSINDISLAHVADEFLAHVKTLGESRVEELADFLVIAARLLVIKSRSLLPALPVELEDGLSLADQLKMYKEFVRAAETMQEIFKRKQVGYFRPFTMDRMEGKFFPPQSVTTSVLRESFAAVLERLKPIIELPKVAMARAVSISECINHLHGLLKHAERVSFSQFIQSAEHRVDVVVSFLALLELIKQRVITVNQTHIFEDITIEHYEHARAV